MRGWLVRRKENPEEYIIERVEIRNSCYSGLRCSTPGRALSPDRSRQLRGEGMAVAN